MRLHRTAAIEGVLLDEFGDPAPNIGIQLSTSEYVAGRRRLMPVPGGSGIQVLTDDKGRFRIFSLRPGSYFVSAGAVTDISQSGGFVPTYYPGTPDVTEARPIRLTAGAEATATFTMVPGKMARLAGRLIDAAGAPIAHGTIWLTLSDRAGLSELRVVRGGTSAQGTFLFRAVPPGSYTLQGFGQPVGGGALGRAPFGWLPVTVDGTDMNDLTVTVSPGATMRGRVVFEGDPGSLKPADVSVFPRPVEFDSNSVGGGGPPRFVMGDDWTFEAGNQCGLRVARVGIRSTGWSLKEITRNGADITDTPIDFRQGDVDGVEIVLTTRGASVEGTVIDAEGRTPPAYAVVVFGANPARWTFPSRFIALARPNQDGRFRVTGLPPDDYFAAAVSDLGGGEWEDPLVLNQLRTSPHTASFSLLEAEAKTLQLRLIAR